jgi:glycosyltransferase involved in cell wall biosynthesis
MKIALVIRDFWPLPGGLTLHTLRLSQEMIRRGHSFQVITRFTQQRYPGNEFFWKTEKTQTFENSGVVTHVIGLSFWERLYLLPLKKIRWRKSTQSLAIHLVKSIFVPKFLKLFKETDVVHYEGGGLELMGFAAHAAAKKLNLPFCIQPSIHIGEWGNTSIDHKFFKLADRILVRSYTERSYLKSIGIDKEKILIVGSGIDEVSKGDRNAFRSKYKISDPLILFLGRKSEDKGYFLLRQAFDLVTQQSASVSCLCVGPPPQIDNDSLLKVSYKNQKILELENVSDEERRDALAACDIFCVPSQGESFGLVFMEAARCGKPIIARDLEVLDELLGKHHAALLIGQRTNLGQVKVSAEEVAEAIIYLLKSPEKSRILGHNALKVSEAFLWKNIILKFENAYQELLSI